MGAVRLRKIDQCLLSDVHEAWALSLDLEQCLIFVAK